MRFGALICRRVEGWVVNIVLNVYFRFVAPTLVAVFEGSMKGCWVLSVARLSAIPVIPIRTLLPKSTLGCVLCAPTRFRQRTDDGQKARDKKGLLLAPGTVRALSHEERRRNSVCVPK